MEDRTHPSHQRTLYLELHRGRLRFLQRPVAVCLKYGIYREGGQNKRKHTSHRSGGEGRKSEPVNGVAWRAEPRRSELGCEHGGHKVDTAV